MSVNDQRAPLVAVINATTASVAPAKTGLAEAFPEAAVWNLLDDRLISEAEASGGLTPALSQRMLSLIEYAVNGGAEAVLLSCSMYGPVLEHARRDYDVPMLSSDEELFDEVERRSFRSVLLLGPLAPAVEDSVTRLREVLSRSTGVTTTRIIGQMADGAVAATTRGDNGELVRVLKAAASPHLKDVDAVVLGNFSLAPARADLEDALQIPVLSAPELAAARLRRSLQMTGEPMTAPPWLGCVADDFTGGTDVAAALRRGGLRTRLFFGPPAPDTPQPECDAVVVALKTRSAPVEQAVTQSSAVVRWLDQVGVDRVYVKYCSTFDSTPAGNIGPIVDACLSELAEPATVLCPASPEHGRTVFQGHLFADDKLLSESSMATHPLTPMTDADLRRVLEPQTPHPVGLLDHAALAAGVDTAAQRLKDLRDKGIRHIISDAVDESDLRTLAAATQQWRVLSGGAGLARAIAELRGTQASSTPLALPAGPSVVIAGSCSAATLRQVEHARCHMAAHHITPATSDDPDEIWSRARAWLDEHAGADSVLVYATASADERARTQHIFGDKTAEIVEDILAKTAQHAVGHGARRVVVAGGETSGAVVHALGVESVLVAQEMDTGVPWCLTTAQPELALLLKSGNFGQPDLLTKAAMTP